MKKFILFFLMTMSSLSYCMEFSNQKEGVWIANHFKFHTGEVFKELKIGYITIGNPQNPAVLILHGTAGSAKGILNKDFGEELFLDGQLFNANQ